jgi:hypothetical protein
MSPDDNDASAGSRARECAQWAIGGFREHSYRCQSILWGLDGRGGGFKGERQHGAARLDAVAGIAVVHRPIRKATDMRLDRPYLAGLRGGAKGRSHGGAQAPRAPPPPATTQAKCKRPCHEAEIRISRRQLAGRVASRAPITIALGARLAPSCPNVNAASSDRWLRGRASACREC